MKIRISILLLSIALIALAAAGARRPNGFEPASDVPRAALVYVQVENLPEFIKFVGNSDQFQKFSGSTTFSDFSKSHLGIKLKARIKEFSDAAGFGFDVGTLSTFADKRAAFALYDIGKLDFVFVAPMSDSVFEATAFAVNRGKFAEEKLPDGTKLFRAKVMADSGRRSQQLIFTHARGRLVVATSDKLIEQTLANIAGKRGATALADEPSFRELASEMKPRLASVWVDQAALNSDYYFKHYWLMSDRNELGDIRAGLFDLGIDERSVSERRVLLTDGSEKSKNIDSRSIRAALRFVPADAPFYTIESADAAVVDRVIAKTLFDRDPPRSGDSAPTKSGGAIYGDKYEMAVDEEDVETAAKIETVTETTPSAIVGKARSVLSFSRPRMLESPLFFETDRAAIVTLSETNRFDRTAFEKFVANRFGRERSVTTGAFEWRSENGWRVLDLPFLGAGPRYRIEGSNLIVTNGFELAGSSETAIGDGDFSELTVINLGLRNVAFDEVFARFKRGADVSFFTSTVGGLLDAAAPAKRIEIRKRWSGKLIEETLVAER